MKLIALAALAATLMFAADEKVTQTSTGANSPNINGVQGDVKIPPAAEAKTPVVKIRALTKDEQLELLGVIAEAGMLTQQAESNPAVVAAKAAVQKQNEVVDRIRLTINCKGCGFNVANGKITVLEPPPPPPPAAPVPVKQ